MKQVLKYIKPYIGFLIVILMAKLTAAVLELMIPSALGDILDIAAPSGSVPLILRYGLKMAIFAVCTAALNISSNITSSHFIHKAVESLRQDLFKKVSSLSSAQLDEVTEASAVTRLTSDTYNITQMCIGCMTMGIRTPILMVGGIFVALQEDVMLTLVLLVAIPLVTFVAIRGNRIAVPKFRARQAASDVMVRTVQENVTGIRVIKALSKTEHEKKRFDGVNSDLAHKTMDATLVSAKKSNTNIFILNTMQAVMILVGALRVNAGLMTAGKIVAFMSYFTMITNAALNIANILMMVSNGTASAQRITEIFEKPQDLQSQDIPADDTPCALEFRHVRFSYLGQANNLEDISFRLEKGQTLGVIGATGSGKTTLVNLLLRFYDVSEGAIYIDGQDIRSFGDSDLRKSSVLPCKMTFWWRILWKIILISIAVFPRRISSPQQKSPRRRSLSRKRRAAWIIPLPSRAITSPAGRSSACLSPAPQHPSPKFSFWMIPLPLWTTVPTLLCAVP